MCIACVSNVECGLPPGNGWSPQLTRVDSGSAPKSLKDEMTEKRYETFKKFIGSAKGCQRQIETVDDI